MSSVVNLRQEGLVGAAGVDSTLSAKEVGRGSLVVALVSCPYIWVDFIDLQGGAALFSSCTIRFSICCSASYRAPV